MRKLIVVLLMVFLAGCSKANKSSETSIPTTVTPTVSVSQEENSTTTETVSPTVTTAPSTDESAANSQSSVMREMTSSQIVADMGIGWNLGNTLEACGDWITGTKVASYEIAWGNPVTTKEMIDGIKAAGFKSVRIPVAWSNMIGDDYTINEDLMNRVEEVVNYVLDDGMYAVVNIHWDNGWFAKFSTDYDGSLKKYTTIWSQISDRFKNYSDYLIFESLNEEGCFDDVWNRYSGSTGPEKQQAYDILNNINQNFVDLVRASGGNNAKRHLLIAGYATDIYLTCDEAFHLPKDPENRIIVSVHYYTPSTFTILDKDASWGKSARTWGTDAEIAQVTTDMTKVKETFVDKGIPVIVGEFGTTLKNKDPESARNYMITVCKTIYDMGMLPMLWDPGTHYNRRTKQFNDKELLAAFQEIQKDSRNN